MTLEEFVGQGWGDHATDATGVWNRLPEGIGMADSPTRIFALANLATHVAGEHLGRWDDGLAFLERLSQLPAFEGSKPEGAGVRRLQAVLEYCAGRRTAADQRLVATQVDPNLHPQSTRVRMLAVAASALSNQRRMADAAAAFEEALRLAAYGPGASDPAARALAVTGNNMAVEFENRPTLDPGERELMLSAARAARQYWEIAGSWMEVERAEYRLALSHLKAGLVQQALHHAEECRRVVEANGAPAGEAFFAHEALSQVRHAMGDTTAARAERDAAAAVLPGIDDEAFKQYCAGELEKLNARLARP